MPDDEAAGSRPTSRVDSGMMMAQSDILSSVIQHLNTVQIPDHSSRVNDRRYMRMLREQMRQLGEISQTVRSLAQGPEPEAEIIALSPASTDTESPGPASPAVEPPTPTAPSRADTPTAISRADSPIATRRRPGRGRGALDEIIIRSNEREVPVQSGWDRDRFIRDRDRYTAPIRDNREIEIYDSREEYDRGRYRNADLPRYMVEDAEDETQSVLKVSTEYDMSHPDWEKMHRDHAFVAYYKEVPSSVRSDADDVGSPVTLRRTGTGDRLRRQNTGAAKPAGNRPLVIRINSRHLTEELEVFAGSKDVDPPLILIPPYKILFFHWKELQETLTHLTEEVNALQTRSPRRQERRRRSPSSSRGAILRRKRAQLANLLDFLKDEYSDYLTLIENIKSKTQTHIRFDQLSFLFSPGDVILGQSNGLDRAYVVYAVTGGRQRISQSNNYPRSEIVFDALRGRGMRPRSIPRSPGYSSDSDDGGIRRRRRGRGGGIGGHSGDVFNPLTLECFYLDYNGTYVAPIQETIQIMPFPGSKEINDLPFAPAAFVESGSDILKKLTLRGRKYFAMMGHRLYAGVSMDSTREEIVGEVYIDPETGYAETTGGWSAHNPRFGELKRRNADMSEFVFPSRRMRRSQRLYERDPLYQGLSRDRILIREASRSRERTRSRTRSELDDEIEVDRTEEFLRGYAQFLSPVKVGEQELSEEQLQLLPEDIYGYVLRSRRWMFLAVDGLSEINKSDEARMRGFNDLVIPNMYRQLLLALVENHARGPKTIQQREAAAAGHMDLVSGKGNGLIILLHGPPGAGKTSTAETIAAYTKRPLYSITCGDIGTLPEDIETNLENHFRLANKWGCVLLLDEADVFMAKRDWHSMERNAAVSVFLRVLEYYSGILFLTTNRTGVIDEAFKSRIHVSLRYPSLDLPSTRQIWENLLGRISRDNDSQSLKIAFDKTELLAFAEAHFAEHEPGKRTWNGRQIRNAFQTAIALGRTDRIKMLGRKGLTEEQAEKKCQKRPERAEKYLRIHLTAKNFRKIAQTAKDFEEYLHIVRGADATIAKNESVRYDDYTPGGPPRPPEKVYPAVPDSIARLAQMTMQQKRGDGARTPARGPTVPPVQGPSATGVSDGGESDSSGISSSDSDDE